MPDNLTRCSSTPSRPRGLRFASRREREKQGAPSRHSCRPVAAAAFAADFMHCAPCRFSPQCVRGALLLACKQLGAGFEIGPNLRVRNERVGSSVTAEVVPVPSSLASPCCFRAPRRAVVLVEPGRTSGCVPLRASARLSSANGRRRLRRSGEGRPQQPFWLGQLPSSLALGPIPSGSMPPRRSRRGIASSVEQSCDKGSCLCWMSVDSTNPLIEVWDRCPLLCVADVLLLYVA